MDESKKTWSGFWSGLIWFIVGLICINISQLAAVILLGAVETAQLGRELSEDRIVELMLDGDLLAIAVVLLLPAMIMMLAFAVKVRRKQALVYFLGFRQVTKSALASWLFYAIALLGVIFVCDRIFGRPPVPESMLAAYGSAESIWLFSLSVAVLAPISEELLYRGYIIRVWAESAIGPIFGTVLLSMMWAATHLQYDLYDMAWIFILGLILCASRLQTRSIIPAMVIHIAWNTVALAMVAYHHGASPA